uniref:Uncharacterized protein n=1 Tax=Opuntia streptacantha TaxID=393608 RepID=A0A7C9AP81_OPUST
MGWCCCNIPCKVRTCACCSVVSSLFQAKVHLHTGPSYQPMLDIISFCCADCLNSIGNSAFNDFSLIQVSNQNFILLPFPTLIDRFSKNAVLTDDSSMAILLMSLHGPGKVEAVLAGNNS